MNWGEKQLRRRRKYQKQCTADESKRLNSGRDGIPATSMPQYAVIDTDFDTDAGMDMRHEARPL